MDLPASKSSLKKGDRIKKIGSVNVRDRGDLAHAAFFCQAWNRNYICGGKG